MSTTAPRTQTKTLHLANPLLQGPDVEELQELLAPYEPGDVDGEYGPATAGAVERAKWALGFPDDHVDTVAGPKLVGFLRGDPLPPDYQARQAARSHDSAKALTVRQQIVAVGRWG